MNNIGEKIKIVRKKKGLSQEELADLATINLRTIQRIENNESEPRGKTLHLICGVLDLNAELDLFSSQIRFLSGTINSVEPFSASSSSSLELAGSGNTLTFNSSGAMFDSSTITWNGGTINGLSTHEIHK